MSEKIEERILKAKLTPKDKIVLDYILKNKQICYFQTANEIAEKLNVSASSVVRLSSKLKYENFSAFKRALQEEYIKKRQFNYVTEIPYEKIKNYESLTDNELIFALQQNILKNIQTDINKAENENYINTAKIISNSKRIFIVGFRACAGFASSFGVMLSCIRPNVYVVSNNQPLIDFLVDLNEHDTVISISFERYSSDTVFATEIAKKAGSKIIAITDSYTSPIADKALITLIITTDNISFYNSYVSFVMSMEIIVGLVSKHNKIQNENRLIKMEEYLKQTGQY